MLQSHLGQNAHNIHEDARWWIRMEICCWKIDRKWNFSHCTGANDGKHVVMRAPEHWSLYFSYKGTFSTVLIALVNADLKFIAIDVGAYDRNSDGGIFAVKSWQVTGTKSTQFTRRWVNSKCGSTWKNAVCHCWWCSIPLTEASHETIPRKRGFRRPQGVPLSFIKSGWKCFWIAGSTLASVPHQTIS